MLWILIGSVVVILGSGVSIWSSVRSRRDIATGRPRFESVADVTGIWKRETLDGILGPRDSEDRYRATSNQIHAIPKTAWKQLFDSELGDTATIIAAIISPLVYETNFALSLGLLSSSAAFIIIGYIGAVFVVVRDEVLNDYDDPS